MPLSKSDVDRVLREVPHLHRGPGAALAVVHNGELLGSYTYGYADLDRRIPMTPQTSMPICSISKQMVCLVYADLRRRPTAIMTAQGVDIDEQFSRELRRLLPHLPTDKLPTVANLFNMQSGIRDYWALTALWGARPDGAFSLLDDAPETLQRVHSLHFAPGTEFSYSNVNFHVLGRMIENVAGHSLGQLLAERVFMPAGMKTAALCPNTNSHPLPCVGYEGDEDVGFFAAVNRMEWSGDAGITASLRDMIEYECYLQESWDDPLSTYRENAQSPTYKDGSPAYYGSGFMHGDIEGKGIIGHSGALRGYRLYRVHIPSERLSVVVHFNHEANPAAAAAYIIRKLLDLPEPVASVVKAAPEWKGDYLDADTQLVITVKEGATGEILFDYAGEEKLQLIDAHHAKSKAMSAQIDGDTVHAQRPKESRVLSAKRIKIPDPNASLSGISEVYSGNYHCSDVDSVMHCVAAGSALYVSFDGFLGRGPPRIAHYIGEDVWIMADPRGLDAPAPGRWTMAFGRDDVGGVKHVTIGTWLARHALFERTTN